MSKDFDYKLLDNMKESDTNGEKLYYIHTYGCQMNEEDSEKLSGMLKRIGYTRTEDKEKASIILFNTCCVRENAENKVFGNLGQLKNLKEKNPNLIIGICGCMMQQEGMADKILRKFPYVNIIFGTHNAYKFPEYLNRVRTEGVQIKEIFNKEEEIVEGLPIDRQSSVKAFVTIMYGCNNFCTYCIVPYVRGRERSRDPEDIINEVKELAENGYKEITLLGQNVNSYLRVEMENIKKGKIEDTGKYDKVNSFAKLLREINKIDGIERIRFVSPHPKDFTDDVIEAIRDCDKVCKLIHLPLQSGSTKMLKVMNRKYTKEQYLDLVDKMKKTIPNLALTTDIIVGFAGETEEDFEDTLDVVKKVGFEQVYMFIYSRRVGTPGDRMENQIPEDIKHERFDRLKKLVESQIEENNKKYVGTIQKVLVEGPSKNNKDMLTGRTDSNKVVIFDGDRNLINQMVSLKIVSEHMWYLKGEVI